ncbi:peptidase U32 [Roseburia inulinivorans]|jgi:putative protease|uniref:U32 family peptidase n=1 Tax=Roseburia inulinivorans TaxID=360807 RepID=UPI000E48D743|nr:U32 family peptidase [Roseburia inulinivorans]RGS65227.1 peptidase U32 [Roseburia inulinivorans]
MKIVAGLGSIDEYETFVKAGADEFFCGYVPFSWAEKYGVIHPLNRREVLFYNVQIGSMSELQILKKMVDYYGKPVELTFNSIYYTGEQYPVIAEIIIQCMAAGFENFIIADPALMLYLRQQKINCGIHLSGETAEVNRGMLEQMLPFGIRRVIFHRKNSLEDMQSCIKEADFPHEYEAFILNELCHFSGAFCNSLHCDELTHLCRVPYELGNLHKKEETDAAQKDVAETDRIQGKEGKGLPLDEDGYLTGSTGCGLCALYRMKQVGITHLKLVGRGNYTDFMEKDIRQLRKALDILENSDSEAQYQKKMKASLFQDGCSQNCYYR